MPRKSKGIRLWLRERQGRKPVYVILGGPKEVSTECGPENVEDANKALQEYLAETFRPNTGQQQLDQISIAEVLTLYMQMLPANSPSRATRGFQIGNLLTYWGEKTLVDVKGSECRAYGEFRGKKANTVRGELKALQAAIGLWRKEAGLAALPQVTLPKPDAPRERVLDRSEVAAMLWACRRKRGSENLNMPRVDGYHVSRFIRLGLATGMRKSALCKLRWVSSVSSGHIDVDRGIIYQRGAKVSDTTKRKPPIVLTAKAVAMVSRWAAMDAAAGGTHVISYRGKSLANIATAFETIVAMAGIGPDVTPHTLKHTHVTWRLWKNEQPWDIAQSVGTDAKTIERVYGHHRRAANRERNAG